MLKITIDLRKIWTFSLVLYIICSTAFSYGELRMLNTYALYFFLGVSVVNVLSRQRFSLNAVSISIIFYTALLLIGLLYTPTAQSRAQGVMYSSITMAILALCVVQYMEDVQDVKIIMTSFMLAGLALALHVYAQYGNEFWDILKETADAESGAVGRLDGDLANANTISMCAMISTIIAAYYLIFEKTGIIKKLLLIAIAVFALIISMVAASKKSLVLIVVSILGIWIYSVRGTHRIGRWLRDLLLLVLTMGAVFYLLGNIPLFSNVVARFEDFLDMLKSGQGTTSDEIRMHMFTEGLEVWLDNLLFGAGTAASLYYFDVFCHSNVVEILMNTGIVGFFVFYAPYAVAGWRYMKNAAYYKQRSKISILLFSLFLSICVSGVAFVYYYDRYFMILMAVILSATGCFAEKSTVGKTLKEG